MLTLVFFWLTGHQRLQRFSLAMLPADHRGGVREGWNEVELRLGLWVRGQLILMGSIFAMTTAAYTVIGLPNALLLGVIAGLAEIVPIVGPALGAVPALLVAAVNGKPETVVLVAIVYVVIQILEGNVLVPLVMRRTIGVPPFLVVLSLLMGAAVGGIVGAFLAVPIAAALIVVLERTQARETTVGLDGQSPATDDDEEQEDRDASAAPIFPSRGDLRSLTAAGAWLMERRPGQRRPRTTGLPPEHKPVRRQGPIRHSSGRGIAGGHGRRARPPCGATPRRDRRRR